MADCGCHPKKGSGSRSAFIPISLIGKTIKLTAKEKAPEKRLLILMQQSII
tara:strand:- start:257 stop:409 length:153 start_codon:yes stop_codon:yes gene_type:complete